MKPRRKVAAFSWLIIFCCCGLGCVSSQGQPQNSQRTGQKQPAHPLVLRRLRAFGSAESSQSGRFPYYVAAFFHYVAIENIGDCAT